VALADLAEEAGLHDLDDAAIVVAGVDLRAHLRDDAGLRGGLADDARLLDVVGERLLAVDVLLQLERGQRGKGVRVLGGADEHGVELAGMIEDAAEIDLLARLRIQGRRLVERRAVDVADGGDVLGGDALQVGAAPAADADHGDAELVPGLRAEDGGARGPGRGGDGAGRLDESASCGSIGTGHGVCKIRPTDRHGKPGFGIRYSRR